MQIMTSSFAHRKIIYHYIQKKVFSIPGSEELFTVEKYKKQLAKPYSKLDLYLCWTSDFSTGNSGPLSNLNKTESNV